MSGSSYTRKKIDVTFMLGTGSFGEDGADTVKLSGLRVSAAITKAGNTQMGGAQVRIYGMTLGQMNKLSTLGLLVTEIRRNTVLVEAGDDSGMSQVFTGTIVNARADFSAMPQVAFNVVAAAGLFEAIKPVAPTSFSGSADVATIMSGLATKMGLKFENNGVSVQLSTPYFPGSGREQAERCATAANINWTIDEGTLAIWPKNGYRKAPMPLLSPTTGLVGYPTYDSLGVVLRTLHNPATTFGALVEIQSSLQPACGTWYVYGLDFDLESETPNGAWFDTLHTCRPGQVPTR